MSAGTSTSETRTIGRYHVLGEVGRGGMGVVYRAEDRLIGRQVAVKTLTEVTPELLERFYIEARSGILSHPNIVTVYELGEHEGSPFIAMEFIDGESLEHILRQRKKIPLLEALSITEQLCAGLGYAHGHGVVHRDVKPANILVRPDGRVTIVDFGIARLADQTHQLTKTDTLLGTFHYIAPERLKGEISDGRADVWSVGVILYEMLTGHLPFKGGDISSLYRVIHEPYTPLVEHLRDAPRGLNRVLDRALAKGVDDRYVTAEEMAVDLQMLGEGLTQDRVGSLLDTARELSKKGQYASARTVLLQAQRIDPANTDTKTLLSDLQEKLSDMQRSEQLRQMMEQAAEACRGKRWDDAVALLEQARKLDVQNLYNLDEQVRQVKMEAGQAQASVEVGTNEGQSDDQAQQVEMTMVSQRTSEELRGLLESVRDQPASHTKGTDSSLDAPGKTTHFPVMKEQAGERFAGEKDNATQESLEPRQSEPSQAKQFLAAATLEISSQVQGQAMKARKASAEALKAAVALCHRSLESGELAGCLHPLEDVAKEHGTSADLEEARRSLKNMRTDRATQLVYDAVPIAAHHLAVGAVEESAKALKQVEYALSFAAPKARREWERLKVKCTSPRPVERRVEKAKTSAPAKLVSAKVVDEHKASRLLLGGIGIAVAGGLVAVLSVWHGHNSAPSPIRPVTSVSKPAPKPVVALSPQVDMEINASPWGKVLAVTGGDGRALALPNGDQTTPLRLEGVAAGTYEVTYEREDGRRQVQECIVSADNRLCTVDLDPLDINLLLKGNQQ